MLLYLSNWCHAESCAGSVVFNQTHPAAPYVCRTGNISIRCQYGTADGARVSWSVGDMSNVNISTIPGHTSLPRTSTYQEVLVDSYTNLRERYQCTVVVMSDVINSNNFIPPQPEGKLCRNTLMQCLIVFMVLICACLQLLKLPSPT